MVAHVAACRLCWTTAQLNAIALGICATARSSMTTRTPRAAGSFAGIGALAGAFAALVFTIVHQIVISPIWFALPAMLAAGALCGTCIAWSYLSVVRTPSQAS